MEFRLLKTCSPQTAFMAGPTARVGGEVTMPWAVVRVRRERVVVDVARM